MSRSAWLCAVACAAVSVSAIDLFSPDFAQPNGTSLTQAPGHMYYRLRVKTITQGSAPTISMVKVLTGDGTAVSPQSVSCEALNEAYCNGAMLGAGPASWNTNCRDLGVQLDGADKNRLEWKFAAPVVITDAQFWLSGNEYQDATFELLHADSEFGEWTVMREFRLYQSSCQNQWTNVHIQDFAHCHISADDWTDWGDCNEQCGGGLQHRQVKSVSSYPQGGGRDCDSYRAAMSRQCNRHACPCAAGQHHNPINCAPCPAGQYQPNRGRQSCMSCTPGRYANATGAASCTLCDPGTASASYGRAIECPACDAGHYALQGARSCVKCLAGQFADLSRASSCQSCNEGTYAPDTDGGNVNVQCSACDPGQYSPSKGMSQCISCPAGFYLPGDGATAVSQCQPCARGSWSSAATASCTPCSIGRYSNTLGATVVTDCLPCAVGTYRSSAMPATLCESCVPGTYWFSRDVEPQCKQCPAGTFNPSERSQSESACHTCTPGRFADTGAVECSGCLAGQYSNATRAGSCEMCASGRHSADGSTRCTSCPAGQYSAPGSEVCADCQMGRYSTVDGAPSSAACLPCLAGQFQPEQGQSRCYDCGRGRFQPATAQMDCVDCAAGTFGGTQGSQSPNYKSCLDCAAGKYQDEAGQGTCKNCSSAHASIVIGATSAARCVACTGPSCPVDCEPESWSASEHLWTACSHTCGSHGTQSRSRMVRVNASNGGVDCSHNPGSERYSLIETRPCNRNVSCPVDCTPDVWGPWSQCSQRCAQQAGAVGFTERTATSIGPFYGGRLCTQGELKQTAECNTHRCLSAGECHANHVKCRVVDESTAKVRLHVFAPESGGNVSYANANASVAHPWAVDCMNTPMHPLSAMRHHHVPTDPRCEANFCQTHNNCTRLEIEHFEFNGTTNAFAMGVDPRASHLNAIDRSQFKCSKTGTNSCTCFCTKHKQCCTKQGMRIKGSDLLGNSFQNVTSAQGCCNLCTSHPQCQGWNYHPIGLRCTLKDGTVFENVTNSEDNAVLIAGRRYGSGLQC